MDPPLAAGLGPRTRWSDNFMNSDKSTFFNDKLQVELTTYKQFISEDF